MVAIKKKPERYKYYAVRIEAVERQVEQAKTNNYSSYCDVVLDRRAEEKVILEHSFKENHSYKTLRQLIMG